jgi:cyclophilin family peptidyl-prolyl cis-trans isomerase
LEEALKKLELPKEIETYNQLQQTIAYVKGEEAPEPKTPAYNHPIDWAMLDDLSEDRLVTINTNRGAITLEMMPEFAPGTVANFIALVRQGFYQDKTIHRVVPNFVIQAGCPRGDGYGSLDYTIRSELPPLYYDEAGYVGMASAGNHTECTQFFITHSPTPHLDGEYTIFARVTDGLEVVHQTQVGDRIKNIEL